MAKFTINVGGKVHQTTESGTVDKDKFQITVKGDEKKPQEKDDKKQEEKRSKQ